MADRRDLELCRKLHCHLEVCILSGQEESMIFLEVKEDPKEMKGVK
jgi:hypothetical protein